METSLEIKGLWHLPENPSQRVAGVLKYEPSEKITLELIGTFTSKEENVLVDFFDDERHFSIIYGETSDGKYITLFHCSKSGSYNFDCSFPLTNFNIRYILQGYYLENFHDSFFDYVEFGIPILSKWIGRNTHNFAIQSSDSGAVATFELGNKHTLKFKYDIDENTQIELTTGSYFNGGHDIFDIRQDGFCRIYSNITLNIQSFISKINIFKSLISIGVLQNLFFSDIKLYNRSLSNEIYEKENVEFGMNLLFVQHVNKVQKSLSRQLFNFDLIENNFEAIIQRWYKNNDDLLPIRIHLLDAISIKRVFSSTDFLILAFAIEGFYFRFRTSQKKTNLISAISKLCKEFRNVKQIKLININKDQVNDSRNYYSHLLNTTEKPNALFGKELYVLAEKLKLLLICCVLKEIGFTDEMIDKSIEDSGLTSKI